MSQSTPERPPATYADLDELAESGATTVLGMWLLRRELPEADWRRAVTDSLALLVQQAEAIGRLLGRRARPSSTPGLPVDGKSRQPAPDDFVQTGALLEPPEADPDPRERDRMITTRLATAVDTLADALRRPGSAQEAADQDLGRVDRLARDEPVQAAQRGYQDGIRLANADRPVDQRTTGYRRGINPDCCQLCFWLWKEAFVYPIDQPMHRHTGCRCLPLPTTDRAGRTRLDPEGRALLNTLYAAHTKEK